MTNFESLGEVIVLRNAANDLSSRLIRVAVRNECIKKDAKLEA